MALSRFSRAVIVAAYFIFFWIALPLVLWRLAALVDNAWGLRRHGHLFGWPIAAFGIGLCAFAIVELWTAGRGLPISALPPSHFIETGPYAWVRHPIYLGFNLSIFGVGLAVGSAGLAWVIAPAFLAGWLVYGLIEEHFLSRRFPKIYPGYRRRISVWPRLRLYGVLRLALNLGFFKVTVENGYKVPSHGGAVLVGNHTCYLDPVYVGSHTRRNAMYLVTADAFRSRLLRLFLLFFDVIQVRRYTQDAVACRQMLGHLQDGGLVAMFPEGERSPLGSLQPPLAATAQLLSRLPYPVIPVGISGAFDVGPRWSGVLRLRGVHVCVGEPIQFDSADPAAAVETSLRALLKSDPQPVHMKGLPAANFGRVLWRCPACSAMAGWQASTLTCEICGARWESTADGLFECNGDRPVTLAELARPVWDYPQVEEITTLVSAWRERRTQGPARRLAHTGEGNLRISRAGLTFEGWHLPLEAVRSCTTERADTLQVATRREMWQFRPYQESVFRLWRAMTVWLGQQAHETSDTQPAKRGPLQKD